MNKKIFAAIFLFGILFAGCGKEVQETKPPLVKVEKVKFSSAATEENYSGTVQGRYETKLSFQVGGKIISRNVQVGEKVSAGQILMTVDPKDVVEQNRGADANLQSATAQLNLAKSNLERYSELFKQNAVAEATLENYQTQYAAAQAAYNAAVAQVEQTKNALSYTNLIANASGVISAINSEVGQVVSAGQNVLTLTQTDELEISANIPENKISEIKIDQPCEVKFWADKKSVEGRVREISPAADPTSRTFPVKISLQNFSAENIQLGMTAEVKIFSQNSKTQEIILPLSSIYQTADKKNVWLVKNDKVELKEIFAEDFENNFVKVRGLSAGDLVVTAGVNKLREGQAVRTE